MITSCIFLRFVSLCLELYLTAGKSHFASWQSLFVFLQNTHEVYSELSILQEEILFLLVQGVTNSYMNVYEVFRRSWMEINLLIHTTIIFIWKMFTLIPSSQNRDVETNRWGLNFIRRGHLIINKWREKRSFVSQLERITSPLLSSPCRLNTF